MHMAEANMESGFMIEIMIDGEKRTVKTDAAMVEALNSTDPMIRHHAYTIIAEQLKVPTSTESNSKEPITCTETNFSASQQIERPQLNDAKISEEGKPFKTWKEDEAKALLILRLAQEDKFLSANNHKILWEKISAELISNNITASADQCNNKFKSMKKEYRACKDKNSLSGESPKYCRFYNEFEEAYGCKESTQPSYTMSSMDSDATSSSSGMPSTNTHTKGKRLRKTRRTATSPVLEWLEGYEKRSEEMETKRLKMVKEMHEEKMNALDRFIRVLEKSKGNN